MSAKKTAKTAIITRTKNRNLLLERAIKSVLNQTDKDYVHVILNDGGDDKAFKKVIDKYPDKNRVVLSNKKSVGLTAALNQAIRSVDSDFISILDDDDTIAPDRVKLVAEYLEKTGAVAVVNVTNKVFEKIENGRIIKIDEDRWLEGVDSINLYKQCLDNYISNGCVTYRRSVYEELDGYDETLPVAEDWDFGLRMLLKYDVDFLVTKHPLTFYHHRPETKGDEGNSVFAGIDDHKRSLNILRNKYLREDINAGKMGVGYIMNNLAYTREQQELQEKRDIEKVVRIEGHVNHVSRDIEHRISILESKTALGLARQLKKRAGL